MQGSCIVTPSSSICSNCFLVGISYVLETQYIVVGKIMKKLTVTTRNLASFFGTALMSGPTGGCRFLVFPLLMLLNCPFYMCHPLTAQKCISHIVLRPSFVYCSLNSANIYTFKHLNNGGSIQNDKTDSKCEIFYRRNKCLKTSQ